MRVYQVCTVYERAVIPRVRQLIADKRLASTQANSAPLKVQKASPHATASLKSSAPAD